MNEGQTTALSHLIIDHIRLARSRRETLVWLMGSILKAGTVNLNRLAPHMESAAQTTSAHRRLERFFSEVRLNDTEVARRIVSALALAGKPWHLAMDRANWQFGKTDLNILVLSVALDDVCVPLFWRVLDKASAQLSPCLRIEQIADHPHFFFGAWLVNLLNGLEGQNDIANVIRLSVPDQFNFVLIFKQKKTIGFGHSTRLFL